ncbi:MAG: shikimate dehydrogenase [Chloroflexi bacterium]|nr:shikimate dehydrogenase [Chloroflexota bacterium]
MTKYVGIIGHRLKHSVSPQFQQAAFDYLKLDVRYEVWETDKEGLPEVIEGLRDPSKLGANVTIPYKESVIPLMDELDETARRIGAVNTIVNRVGRLTGYNTDGGGFIRALRRDAGFEPEDKRVVILGAGGAARAAGYSLVESRVRSLSIINRTAGRGEALASALRTSGVEVVASAWKDGRTLQALMECDLLVNCTSVGMKNNEAQNQLPIDVRLIPTRALVYDVVYNPVETPLLAAARQAGARTMGGLPMLVYQGAAAFELWTGRPAPVDIMMSTAKKALTK